jgi:hypothetical protein
VEELADRQAETRSTGFTLSSRGTEERGKLLVWSCWGTDQWWFSGKVAVGNINIVYLVLF